LKFLLYIKTAFGFILANKDNHAGVIMPTQAQQQISITELERAINYWRSKHPSSRETMTLCPQASCLAELYARMIVFQTHNISIAEFSVKAKKAFLDAEQAFTGQQNKAA
jgi:hypothetical protein